MPDTTLFKTILCPVDFSQHSLLALEYAAILSTRNAGKLIVIFAEDPLLAAAASVSHNERELIDKGRTELRRVVDSAIAPYGVPRASLTIEVAVGAPHKVIEATAAKMKCDLIVMGAHGWTGASELMMGSTTHRILRRSRCLFSPRLQPGIAMNVRRRTGQATSHSRRSIWALEPAPTRRPRRSPQRNWVCSSSSCISSSRLPTCHGSSSTKPDAIKNVGDRRSRG